MGAELCPEATSVELGQKLANAWRDTYYTNQKLDAASLVYTKAPEIVPRLRERW